MELFRLSGVIDVDNTSANKALEETSQTGQETQSKLSKFFGGIGKGAVVVGKAVATGMAVGGAAVAGLATKSIQAYADYEQLVGGVETLFDSSAKKVKQYADMAYETAGMSANEYMETVTSFSASLLQSLNGDTSKAADKANQAIIDMSDNANKMGSSMESIQNAYQGFAKQNYTMLDNLKLGYGGTKEEMARLLKDAEKISGQKFDLSSYADVVDAIHVIQTEMGITGTTAKEASSTISGSIGQMKASWQNLVAAMANDDLDPEVYINGFVASVSTVMDNVLPRIETALSGIVYLVQELAPKIIEVIPRLVDSLLPPIIEATLELLYALVGVFPSLVQTLLDVIPYLLEAIVVIVDEIIYSLPELMQTIISALPQLIPDLVQALIGFIQLLCIMLPDIIQPIFAYLPSIIISLVDALIQNLPMLIDGVVSLVLGIVQALPQIIQGLVGAIPQIVSMVVNALIENIPLLIDGAIQIVMGIVAALPQIIQGLVVALPLVLKSVWDAVVNVFKNLPQWFNQLFNGIRDIVVNIWGAIGEIFGFETEGIKNTVTKSFEAMKNIIVTVWNAIKNNLSTVLNAIKNVISTVWNSIKNVVSTVINSVKSVISTVWNAIKVIIANVMNIIFSVIKGDWTSVKQSITNIINAIKSVISSVWNAIKAVISSVMSGIKSTISSIWNGIKSVVSSVVNGIKSTISSVWNGIKSVTSDTWNKIKTSMTSPIEAARDKIKGIVDKVKGFFQGVKLQFPNVKLPHFGISPSGWKIGDLLKGKIPKLSIKWYAEAMRKPMIMTKPTVFGYDAATGKLMGGGEAGSEVLTGTGTLLNMISNAVAMQNETLVYYLQKIIEILCDYFPQVLEALMNMGIVLDDGTLVGRLAPAMDIELGKIKTRKDRGR